MEVPAARTGTSRAADLVVLLLLAGLVVLYCIDAVRASTDILNLILVLPLSIVVLVLCIVQFVSSARGLRPYADEGHPKESPASGAAVAAEPAAVPPGSSGEPSASESESRPLAEVLPVVGLFAIYILTLPWLGFDAGTCLFIAAFLWLQGERRPVWLVGYSIGFGLVMTFFFSRMLPYPMPLLILGAG
jgi:putative tricarboxylic transport membrane protein